MQKNQEESSHEFSKETINRVALTSFFAITEKWNLKENQKRILLGDPPIATYNRWKKNLQGELSRDTLERISYILGIYKALGILLPNEISAHQWIKKINNAPLFNGHSALEKMLLGNVTDLADIRRYLDAQRGW